MVTCCHWETKSEKLTNMVSPVGRLDRFYSSYVDKTNCSWYHVDLGSINSCHGGSNNENLVNAILQDKSLDRFYTQYVGV